MGIVCDIWRYSRARSLDALVPHLRPVGCPAPFGNHTDQATHVFAWSFVASSARVVGRSEVGDAETPHPRTRAPVMLGSRFIRKFPINVLPVVLCDEPGRTWFTDSWVRNIVFHHGSATHAHQMLIYMRVCKYMCIFADLYTCHVDTHIDTRAHIHKHVQQML